MRAIHLEAVSVSYASRAVIRDVTLRLEPGERVALLGPSGSGKTTLLRLVAGFIAPDRGEVRMGGEVVASEGRITVPPEERGVGMVFQDLALWPHMTVYGNLAFGLRAKGMGRPDLERKIHEMLEMVGLRAFADSRPTRLSGGEQQRVALARALVLRPDALLMDEPLASVDENLNQQLRRLILRLHDELGFTLLYVTHRADEANEIVERVVYMDGSGTADRAVTS